MDTNKYIPYQPVELKERTWPSKRLDHPPIWCSVDLRDGNQALIRPMDLDAKLSYFKMLVELGIKEIEIGFPAASDVEFQTARTLIEGGHIPEDVAIQVFVQARPHLIKKTFDAIKGAKHVIFHFYNSISPVQREVVFGSDIAGVTKLAVDAAALIRDIGKTFISEGMDLRYEYTPESFSASEPDVAIHICQEVLNTFGATPDRKVILNLPTTVENMLPNQFADLIEYFILNLPSRDCSIISVHPHNDRGCAIATAELAQLAGAERVEGTLFANGERTGNVDLITLALNLFSQGIDPKINCSDIVKIRQNYERITGMHVHERHPYAGQLVFTAFSGSHQDAINKSLHYRREHNISTWNIPYLPIDPADIGRRYDSIIRINSQSGKGGAAFVLETNYGFVLPKAMRPEFGAIIQKESERTGAELTAEDVFNIFSKEYIEVDGPYRLKEYKFDEKSFGDEHSLVSFTGLLTYEDKSYPISGSGNGPIDAFFNAVRNLSIANYHFVSYSEHAVSSGSDSRAAAYIQLQAPDGKMLFGVGLSHNIYMASIRGILCAINRGTKLQQA